MLVGRRVRIWLSRLWLALVLAALGWGWYHYPVSLQALFDRVGIPAALASLAMIVVGKALTIRLVKDSLDACGEGRGSLFAWYAYSMADLAKYLPGGIWGIAGRLVIYRKSGISIMRSGKIFGIETALLLAFSMLIGCALLSGVFVTRFGGVALLTLPLCIVLLVVALKLCLPGATARFLVRVGVEQALSWLSYGISFGILVSRDVGIGELLASAGMFDLSFAAGMLAFFAPSGLGIREAVVTWLSVIQFQQSPRLILELAILHRLIWMIADVLVFFPVLLRKRVEVIA